MAGRDVRGISESILSGESIASIPPVIAIPFTNTLNFVLGAVVEANDTIVV
jgi:hypothetical protein